MHFPTTIATVLVAGLVILAGSNPSWTALSCNPMKGKAFPNPKLKGQWKMSTEDTGQIVCTFDLSMIGVVSNSACISTTSGGSGTVQGTIAVSSACKVSGTLNMNYPAWSSTSGPRTYTLDAALHQSANASGSIIMGAATGTYPAQHNFFFWMIQVSN
jgi:hypothetical protein